MHPPRAVKRPLSMVIVSLALGCNAPAARPEVHRSAAPTGLYWGRWGDVPDGVRVQVWLHGSAERLRGTWELPPWHGELAGARAADGYEVVWREESVVAGATMRVRHVRLRADATGALRGALPDGAVELVPAGMPDATLRPGVWLSRWTGLPAGMGVETVLSRTPDGRWRAAYRYQEREGAFEGDTVDRGALAIHWREVSTRGTVAQGAGLLRPSITGMFGTYGVGAESEGTGFWSLEPMERVR